MLPPPASPLAPHLQPDGVVCLQQTGGYPTPPTPRVPGHLLLPSALPAEQGLVWLFPRLLGQSLHPSTVHNHLQQAWNWAFGAAVHRAIITNCTPDTAPKDAARAISDRITPLLSMEPPTMQVAQIAALLDQHIDVFGPSDEAQFQAWRWGRIAEYELGHSLGPDTWKASTADFVRYGSRDDMDMLDTNELQNRVQTLLHVYMSRCYDIAALWRGSATSAQQENDAARLQRNAMLRNGVLSTYQAYQNHRDRRALRHAARASAMNDAALADLRRARASRLRRR